MSSPSAHRASRSISFLVVSSLVLGACLIGGRSGPPGALTLTLGGGIVLPAGWFIALFIGLFGLSLAATLLFPRGLSFRRAFLLIMALSITARILLLPHPASDDVNRYLWEGRILAEGESPYSHAPVAEDDPEVDRFRDDDDPIWRGINHPTYTAIYPPLMLLLLAGVASLSYSVIAVKLTMIAFDLATLIVLLFLLKQRRIELRWALLYGLSPVILFAFAGQGHNDAVQLFCVAIALLLSHQRHWRWAWLFLGLAVQAKVIAVLAWPFFIQRISWRHLWPGLLVAAVPTFLFLLYDGAAIFESFFAFGYDMSFNGPTHSAILSLVGSTRLATVICQICFLIAFTCGLSLLHPDRGKSLGDDATAGLFFTFGAFLLLSPTVHFWYLTWIIPFLVLRPTLSWQVLTATIAFTFVPYGVEFLTGSWSFPWWGPWAVWALPLFLMARDLRFGLKRLRFRRGLTKPLQRPHRVSVIIPTLNEAERIAACLDPILHHPLVKEIFVVDAGSSDDTCQIARQAGAVVVEHTASFENGGGRGGQIAAGLARSKGDVVIIIHADTVVSTGTVQRVVDRLADNPDVIGGAVGSAFDGRGFTLRLLELANDFRAAFLGISFGDQVQFFRSEVIELGYFPDIPLMEDVELSLRLHHLGRACFLWGGCTVSPRRWQRGNALNRAVLVIRLTSEYLLRRLVGQPDTVAMYKRYYGARG